jgi:hypothetical protein
MLCILSVWRIRQMYLQKNVFTSKLDSQFFANPLGSEQKK